MHLSLFAAFEWIGWFADPANWPTVLAVAGGLGFVIFVHELGHFLVAKACGVKCEKFYLGFDIYGIKLAKFQWGETEYGIGILPLGGYVKMLGQDDNPARMAEETRRAQLRAESAAAGTATASENSIAAAEHAPALTHGDLPPEPVSDPHTPYDPRSYMAQSVPKRMAIISAGVIMNVIFAFLMASLAYGLGVKEVPCTIGEVMAGGTAWKENLQSGDKIVRIGDLKNPRFRDLQSRVTMSEVEKGIEFEIERPGHKDSLVIPLHPDDKALGIPRLGIAGNHKTRLSADRTVPNSAKLDEDPMLKAGDRITKVGDDKIETYADLLKQLALHVDDELTMTAERPPAELRKILANISTDKVSDETKDKWLAETAKPVVVKIPPTQARDIGLVMTMGPITSVQKESPAAIAGIEPGDRLVKIDGKDAGNPLTLPNRMAAAAKRGETVTLLLERTKDGKKSDATVSVKPQVSDWYNSSTEIDPLAVPALGIAYYVQPIVTAVLPDSPAAKAGIAVGDEVTRFQFIAPKLEPADKDKKQAKKDGDEEKPPEPAPKDSPVFNLDAKTPEWVTLMLDVLPYKHTDTKIKLWLTRDGKKQEPVEISSELAKLEDGSDWNLPKRGFAFEPVTFIRYATSVGEAFSLGGRETVENLLLVYRFLQRIGQNRISVRMMSGPVGIAHVAGMKVQEGFASFLLFLTMLSANLAVVNFLPIPVLDGGHMVFLAYEGIRGKPASERVVIAFTYAGLIFLLTLMLFVLSLDLGWISRR